MLHQHTQDLINTLKATSSIQPENVKEKLIQILEELLQQDSLENFSAIKDKLKQESGKVNSFALGTNGATFFSAPSGSNKNIIAQIEKIVLYIDSFLATNTNHLIPISRLHQQLGHVLIEAEASYQDQKPDDILIFIKQNQSYFESNFGSLLSGLKINLNLKRNDFDLYQLVSFSQLILKLEEKQNTIKQLIINEILFYFNSTKKRLHVETILLKGCDILVEQESHSWPLVACALSYLAMTNPNNRALSSVCLDILTNAKNEVISSSQNIQKKNKDKPEKFFFMLELIFTVIHTKSFYNNLKDPIKHLLSNSFELIPQELKDLLKLNPHFNTYRKLILNNLKVSAFNNNDLIEFFLTLHANLYKEKKDSIELYIGLERIIKCPHDSEDILLFIDPDNLFTEEQKLKVTSLDEQFLQPLLKSTISSYGYYKDIGEYLPLPAAIYTLFFTLCAQPIGYISQFSPAPVLAFQP